MEGGQASATRMSGGWRQQAWMSFLGKTPQEMLILLRLRSRTKILSGGLFYFSGTTYNLTVNI